MSFARFSDSDIYMYEHVGGYIECCGCCLIGEGENDWFVKLNTPREALDHLDSHERAGNDIGGARRSIEREYKDLDAHLTPYRQEP